MKEITIKLTFDKTWDIYKEENIADDFYVIDAIRGLAPGVTWQIQPQRTSSGAWISVEDRLPEEGGRYWCYVEEVNDLGISHYEWNCYFDPNNKEFRDDLKTMKVTHWTYLIGSPNNI
jgi:hypothetical protein